MWRAWQAEEDRPVNPEEWPARWDSRNANWPPRFSAWRTPAPPRSFPPAKCAREHADPAEAARAAAEEQERRKQMKKENLEQMRAYVDAAGCRRELLLRYLNEEFSGPCNFCDNCAAASGEIAAGAGASTRREVV